MRLILYTDNGVNGGPQRCVPPEHGNRVISGKRVFVDAFKDGEVRSSWVWVALNPISRFLVRDKRRETDIENKTYEDEGRHGREEGQRQRGRLPGKPEAKIQAEPRSGRIGAVVAIKELLAGSVLCEPAISRGSSQDSKFSQWSFPVAALEPSWCFMMCLQP